MTESEEARYYWHCEHEASIVSETDTIANIKVTCYWKNDNWRYDVNYVSAWVYCNGVEKAVKTESWVHATDSYTQRVALGSYSFTVNKTTAAQNISCYAKIDNGSTYGTGTKSSTAANISVPEKTSYTVAYNANGGSGELASQKKWHGEALTLLTTKPTRTGYTFQGWATSASGSVVYNSGASYSVNAAITLYAVWKANTYTVAYNANGGSGAPVSQTKVYGQTLALSSVRPTRENYNFKGWATSESSTTVAYAPGASYTANKAAALYAVWEIAYTKPRITDVQIYRTNGSFADDSGKDVCVVISVECDYDITDCDVLCKKSNVTGWDDVVSEHTSSYPIGKTGVIRYYWQNLSAEYSYTFRIYVNDGGSEDGTVIIRTIAAASFPIDFKPPTETEEAGVSIGKPAELAGVFDIGLETLVRGGFRHLVLEPNTDLNDVKTPNTYIGANIASNAYGNCPLASGTFTLTVEGAGESTQLKQILTRCSKTEPERYIRFFYQSTWSEWMPDVPAVVYVKTASTDLNDYVQTGVWYFNTNYTPASLPAGSVNGWLVVLRADNGAIKQIWLRYGRLGINDFNTYVRTGNGEEWSTWRRLATEPEVLFDGSTDGTVTLSETAANFAYLEIIYSDNNGKQGGFAKIDSPNGVTFCASLIEASTASVTYIRRTAYTISGTSITPNTTTAAYHSLSGNSVVYKSGNYIKILKVLGHRA